jgi:phosphoenolpyruvate phosphomutase
MQDFQKLFKKGRLATIVGAYDAVTASLVEKIGFDALWVSSYCVALSQFALPDMNIVSYSEMLESARRMRAASGLPMMLDAANGYGSDLILQRVVRECIASDIQAISVDDNEFPGTCSLYHTLERKLISIEKMQARILCARRVFYQGKRIFVTARTESLIVGIGKSGTVERIQRYVDAGADAVLIHSRTFEQLAEVVDALDIAVPIVAIPTLYPDVSRQQLLDRNISAVILANQVLRASVKAIVNVLRQMKRVKTFRELEDGIISLREIEQIAGLESYLP